MMRNFLDRYGLPLLMKELSELSARRQTYTVRWIYAAAMSVIGLFVWSIFLSNVQRSVAAVLTIGPAVGQWIYWSQLAGINWLWPLIACSAFTAEKERNTLQLLLLTRLGPWAIVLEKLLSRLVLIGSLLLISLPLLALCLAVGGTSTLQLSGFFLQLAGQAVLMTAISIMCSAWCQTTGGALVVTYFAAIGFKSVAWSIQLLQDHVGSQSLLFAAFQKSLSLRPTEMVPTLLITAVCLVLTRRFVVTRCSVTHSETSLKAFVDGVGRWANRMNQNSITRGAVIFQEGRREPDCDPVAWRERTTRALAQPRYLIGNLLALEIPILWFLIIVVARLQGHEVIEIIATMQMYLWIGMCLMIVNVVSGMIIQERQKQTWETLLVTPLRSRDIVQQKMDGIQRMLWILQAPLWTCMVFRGCYEGTFAYFANEASMLLIYPRLIAWVAITCGILYQNRIQAMVMSLLVSSTWILGGAITAIGLTYLVHPLVKPFDWPELWSVGFLSALQFCPLTLLYLNLSSLVTASQVVQPIDGVGGLISLRYFPLAGFWNLLLYWFVLRGLRNRALAVADRNLRPGDKSRNQKFGLPESDEEAAKRITIDPVSVS